MALQVKILAAKPKDLSLILGTCMLEGKNQLPKLFFDLYTCECLLHTGTHTHTHTWTHTHIHTHAQI